VALVTGATGTLGKAVVQRFAKSDHDVAVHFRSNEAAAEELIDFVKLFQVNAIAVEADFDTQGVDELSDAVIDTVTQQLGAPSVVVLNASPQDVTPWDSLNSDAWDQMYGGSLRATASLVRAASNEMRKHPTNNNVIVIIGSIEGIRPAAGHAPYATLKAAMHHLVAAAAHELGKYGVRVVGVAPGLINTETMEQDWPEGLARFNKAAALARPVTAEEVAQVVAFVASPAASAITGVTIPVDAGWSAHPGW